MMPAPNPRRALNPIVSSELVRILAILVFAGVFALLTMSCARGGRWTAARPPGTHLIAGYSYESGSIGFGYTDRVFSYNGSFDDVVASYRSYVQAHGGTESQAWQAIRRYELGDECVFIEPWSYNDDKRWRFSTSELATLDESSGAFVESTPHDCQDRG